MKEIQLTKGYVCKVDDADYEALNRWKWHVNIGSRGTIYARRTETYEKGKRRHIFMHCHLMGLFPGSDLEGDHIDQDGLNNQRKNLRVCTHSKNLYNRRKFGSTSQYKGVVRRGKKWEVTVCGKYISTHESEIEAARMYDITAIGMIGEYASLNFPHQQPTTTQGAIQ